MIQIYGMLLKNSVLPFLNKHTHLFNQMNLRRFLPFPRGTGWLQKASDDLKEMVVAPWPPRED